MSKKKNKPAKIPPPVKSRSKTKPGAEGNKPSSKKHVHSSGWFTQAGIRETIESIAIALILAFVFRTFEAEAFVIPTGSMAPTLMGRHKDVVCPKCGYAFQASASNEVNQDTGRLKDRSEMTNRCTCPMCRHEMRVAQPNPQHKSYSSYHGDRILVAKFPYRFSDPERFDVVVFKFPDQARTNYIKRLIGLPGETVRIYRGDIYIKGPGEKEFTIARKPDRQLEAVLQPVYDDDFIGPLVAEDGWPQRWTSEPPESWKAEDGGRVFETDGASATAWLRYRHIVPSTSDWDAAEHGASMADREHRPQLISDFTAYNTAGTAHSAGVTGSPTLGLGHHWVGDLAVDCTLDVLKEGGFVVFQLVEGGRFFECRIDVTTGEAALSIDGEEEYHPKAKTPIDGPGTHSVMFSNIDDELRLWVDGRRIEFDAPTAYSPLENIKPTEDDLSPVGIASEAAALRVSHLRVRRDLYYIASRYDNPQRACFYDYKLKGAIPDAYIQTEDQLADFMQNPRLWRNVEFNEQEFPLEEDQFFMLGDNSAASKDSRLWGPEYFVDRDLLIGKAIFIYWPHSWHKIPFTDIPFPFFPNVGRMGFVR